jgi:hypothetical protein
MRDSEADLLHLNPSRKTPTYGFHRALFPEKVALLVKWKGSYLQLRSKRRMFAASAEWMIDSNGHSSQRPHRDPRNAFPSLC